MASFTPSGGAGALKQYEGEAFTTPRDVPEFDDSTDNIEGIGAKDAGDAAKRKGAQKAKKVGGAGVAGAGGAGGVSAGGVGAGGIGGAGGVGGGAAGKTFTISNTEYLDSADSRDLLVTLIRANLQPRTTFDEMFSGHNATEFLRKFDSWLDVLERGEPAEKVEDARLVSRHDVPKLSPHDIEVSEIVKRMERMMILSAKAGKEKDKMDERHRKEVMVALGQRLPMKVNTIVEDPDHIVESRDEEKEEE
ncbi:hypothetical protein MY11210_007612 [Beauveria gryllotalpidicola]